MNRKYPGKVIQGFFPGGKPHASALLNGTQLINRKDNPSFCIKPGKIHDIQNAYQLNAERVNLNSNGVPLTADVLQKMEKMFNADLSAVRIHHQRRQAESIGALAFTTGNDIYFASGRYNPHSIEGRKLLGHELTHVLQQKAGRVINPFGNGVAAVHNPLLETEAERMGIKTIEHFRFNSSVLKNVQSNTSIQLMMEVSNVHPDYDKIIEEIKKGNVEYVKQITQKLTLLQKQGLIARYVEYQGFEESGILWLLPLLTSGMAFESEDSLRWASDYRGSRNKESMAETIATEISSFNQRDYMTYLEIYAIVKAIYQTPPTKQEVITTLEQKAEWARNELRNQSYTDPILAKRLTTLAKCKFYLTYQQLL